MNEPVTLEICANSVTSALAAQQGGAVRVELCENLNEAGTTPSYGQIALTRKLLHIQVYALIRPRPGDFLYSDHEFEIMLADISNCANAGCDGIAIGLLKANGTVDKERCATVVQMAHKLGLGVTFHRAFDICDDYFKALEDIIEIGFERILTSGGKTTAIEGAGTIAHLTDQAKGRIKIMAGSGINEHNVTDLVRFTAVSEIHTSAKVHNESRMEYHNTNIMMGNMYRDLYTFETTSADRVKKILELANSTPKI